jgi:acyl homoserine lactone synthase
MTYFTLAHFTDLRTLFYLRHEIFVVGQNYQVPTYNGMEFDEFDTPAAHYILAQNLGCARVIPCDAPYMLQQLWQHLAGYKLPQDGRVWEISRLGVSPHAPDSMLVIGELFESLLQLATLYGIDAFVFVTQLRMLQRLLPGVDVEPMGERTLDDGSQACRIVLTPEVYATVRKLYSNRNTAR